MLEETASQTSENPSVSTDFCSFIEILSLQVSRHVEAVPVDAEAKFSIFDGCNFTSFQKNLLY